MILHECQYFLSKQFGSDFIDIMFKKMSEIKSWFFFHISSPICCDQTEKADSCSAFHWIFIFKTGHGAAYDLCTYYMENTQKVREQLHTVASI